jgi:hypothetical protein
MHGSTSLPSRCWIDWQVWCDIEEETHAGAAITGTGGLGQ